MLFKPGELTPDRSVRHLYGADLRRHRMKADTSLAQLAGQVPCSKSQLARIETAESIVPPGLSEEFDRIFGTDGHFTRLYGLVRREVHPDQYRRYMSAESAAESIAHYAAHVVPGLLQTEAYARALLRCDPDTSAEKAEELVAARMSRQERLTPDGAPYIWAILDEAVVRRPIGGPQVMHDQLAALLPLTDTATTKIQVLPYSHGAHALLGGPLTLLKLPNGVEVAYEEGLETSRLFEDPRDVSRRQRIYDALRAYALSPKDTAALIEQAMEDYGPCDPPA
ncbi:helix-turn-helix domain-containing protein [Streptomyces johnsoniae]|uniref:Helix-turn-helix transcriptional regulator n=1 Tax=Streptomyces johnsoniae TaxID=3075532 RepID=A0ABU2S4V5_9ACTN|nr:helix-turn-helix transcriptional regulator [Streptomyces sp. DSM 41886]MDT0444006.1 helix-turn-helix transcriptional regulator [Streptomyces sp. DSM 41886]